MDIHPSIHVPGFRPPDQWRRHWAFGGWYPQDSQICIICISLSWTHVIT
jgi:hypothetical protein